MSADVLSERALGRATLARQLLLERAALPVLDAVRHLVGLQAQIPLNPYLGLWSRLEGFRPEELARLLVDREVVRIVVMRGTIHLVTADDALLLRPLVQPVLEGEIARHRDFGRPLQGLDLAPVLAYARELFAEAPRTGKELRAAFAARFPELDSGALALACRNHLALVQVPPRGVWGEKGEVRSTTAETWLGRTLVDDPSIDEVTVRYLRAFGPATTADIASWSRLTGLAAVVDRLRPQLRTFRDERGRELFDLPDAPRPDPGTPAPTRFLPEYDNVLLSHADRSRFGAADDARRLTNGPGPVHGTVLHDGRVVATWRLLRSPGEATLVVDHLPGLTKAAAADITAEATAVLDLLAADAPTHDLRFEPLDT
jgi:hypothetical protein